MIGRTAKALTRLRIMRCLVGAFTDHRVLRRYAQEKDWADGTAAHSCEHLHKLTSMAVFAFGGRDREIIVDRESADAKVGQGPFTNFRAHFERPIHNLVHIGLMKCVF